MDFEEEKYCYYDLDNIKNILTYIHTYVSKYVCIHLHTHIHTYIHTYIHAQESRRRGAHR